MLDKSAMNMLKQTAKIVILMAGCVRRTVEGTSYSYELARCVSLSVRLDRQCPV